MHSIAAAVLGGVGFLGGQGAMRGALAGSLLMSILINVMFFMGLPLVAQYVVQGLIIVGDGGAALDPRLSAEGVVNAACACGASRPPTAARSSPTRCRDPVDRRLALDRAASAAYGHLRYIVELAAVIGLVGIGQTLVVIGGGIDLSVSAIITVAAIILPLVTFDATPPGSARSRWRCSSRPVSAW